MFVILKPSLVMLRVRLVERFSLMAVVALVLVTLVALFNFQDRFAEQRMLARQAELRRIQERVSRIEYEMTLARLDESRLISSDRTRARAEAFEHHYQEAVLLVDSMPAATPAPVKERLTQLRSTFDRYHSSVDHTRRVLERIGLAGASGSLNELRAAESRINELCADLEDMAVQSALFRMQLRAREFTLTLDMTLADEIEGELNTIAGLLTGEVEGGVNPQERGGSQPAPSVEDPPAASPEPSPEDAGPHAEIIGALSQYRGLVKSFLDGVLELELAIAENTLIYERVRPEVALARESLVREQLRTDKRQRMRRQNSVWRTLLVFGGGLLLLLLLLYVQIGGARRLVARLRVLADSMRRFAEGESERELTLPGGTDEVGALSTAFRRMVEKIGAQVVEIERERERADHANQAKSRYLSSISHDLRTPLNAIIGYSELLIDELEEAGSTDHVKDLSKIRAAARHLLELINGLLDLSKIEAGKMELYEETLPLREFIEPVTDAVRPLAGNNNNTFALRLDDDAPAELRADQTKLRQILINLLGNACKFTSDGTITLRVGAQARDDGPGWVRFDVIDTGIGIPEDKLVRLFQRFTQADASTQRKFGGTGLGLALCREFVELMRGEIGVQSAPGQGTRFHVLLPIEGAGERELAAES